MLSQFGFKENPEHSYEISLHEEAEEMERWRMTNDGYDFHDHMH